MLGGDADDDPDCARGGDDRQRVSRDPKCGDEVVAGSRVCGGHRERTAAGAPSGFRSAAETVVATESAELSWHGLRSETTFLRVALDRLGIRAQFSHIAEYKTATHRFLYPKMTPPQREMLDTVLSTTFAHLIAVVAEARGVAETSVEEAIDVGLMTAMEAQGRKLIDLVAFEDELPRVLAQDGSPARLSP